MKGYFTTVILAAMFGIVASTFFNKCTSKKEVIQEVRFDPESKVRIIVIDSCEYITSHNWIGITHKGNCNNSKHIYYENYSNIQNR